MACLLIPVEINDFNDIQVKFYKAGDILPTILRLKLRIESDWHVAVQTGREYKIFFEYNKILKSQ